MQPIELLQVSQAALAVTGPVEWPSPDEPQRLERLTFLAASETDGEPVWTLVAEGDEDYTALETGVAAALVRTHLQTWLAERGWQVQLSAGKNRRWRLVDCLSFAEGGGDRLDAAYPYGEDELQVLCDSVEVVAGESRGRRIAGP